MKKSKCKLCNKNYNSLAGDTCFYCNPNHWYSYWNKLFIPKK